MSPDYIFGVAPALDTPPHGRSERAGADHRADVHLSATLQRRFQGGGALIPGEAPTDVCAAQVSITSQLLTIVPVLHAPCSVGAHKFLSLVLRVLSKVVCVCLLCSETNPVVAKTQMLLNMSAVGSKL
jgi:hypothetical protein